MSCGRAGVATAVRHSRSALHARHRLHTAGAAGTPLCAAPRCMASWSMCGSCGCATHHEREEADGQLAMHYPLLRLTVGLTAVVDEAAQVALRQGVGVGGARVQQGVGGVRSSPPESCNARATRVRSSVSTQPAAGLQQALAPYPARRVDHLAVANVHKVVVALPRLNEVLLAAIRWVGGCAVGFKHARACAGPHDQPMAATLLAARRRARPPRRCCQARKYAAGGRAGGGGLTAARTPPPPAPRPGTQ